MKDLWRGVGLLFLAVLLLSMAIPLLCQFMAVALWPVVIFTLLVITVKLVWFYTAK